MVNKATRVPTAVGLKTSVTVHDAPAAKVAPQVFFEMLKSPGLVLVRATLLMGTAVEPLLVNVADLGAPPTPTDTIAQLMLDGLTVKLPAGAIPVPDRATFCGLLLAESTKLRVAVRAPTAAVLKKMVAVQLAWAARLGPQVLLEIAKSAGLAPAIDMLVSATELAVPLVKVTDSDLPLEPAYMLPNAKLDGLAATIAVEAVPKPESGTFCGLLLAESVKLKVAVRVPVATGLKWMVTVQLASAARLDPQVLLAIAKSAALVPAIATLLMVIEAEPPFVNVTDLGAPTLPSGTLAQLRLAGLTVAAARHFDPPAEHRARSVTNINDLDLRILVFPVEVFAEEAEGARNSCVIRHSMGGSFFTSKEHSTLNPTSNVAL